ncbi:nuclear pore complex protein nup85 [Echinococcus multilocularis]|uniref:Nuclear pore complex protein Nup85 n=1 Tax=Echinococcus multilocularis TaxID=6211 RepID=A0A068YCK2_ECHMU|nr:nuclear pore complex protein nup85 [Echinococcus multilocularis]
MLSGMTDDICTVALQGPLSFAWSSSQKITVFQSSLGSSLDATLYEVQPFASAKKNAFMLRLIRASYGVCDNLPAEKLVSLTADGDLVKTFELLWHLSEVVILQSLTPGKLTSALSDWYFVQSQEAINVARNLLEKSHSKGGLLKLTNDSERVFWSTALSLTSQVRPMEVSALLASHHKANSGLFRDIRQLLVSMPLEDFNSIVVDATWQKGGCFEKAWHHWQSVCNVRLIEETRNNSRSDDIDTEYLVLILSILAGRNDCWNDPRVVDACGYWYFQFVGWLFYTHHFVDHSSLSAVLEHFMSNFEIVLSHHSEAHSFSTVIDDVIKHIFAEDILSVVFTLSEKFNNWWMVAHFANLVKHLLPDCFNGIDSARCSSEHLNLNPESADGDLSGKGSRTVHLVSSMPDFFLMRYAENLAADASLLNVALGYLDHCTTLQPTARAVQVSLLRRTKPTTNRLTQNLIQLAKKHQLHGVVGEIARTKTRMWLSHSHPSLATINTPAICSALGWAIVAQDVQLIAHIVTRTLSYSMSNKCADVDPWKVVKEVASIVTCLSSGENRGPASQRTQPWLTPLVVSPEFAFISRYSELHCQLNANNAEVITHTVLDLLSMSDNSGGFHVPLKFKLHLLGQLKPHLNPATMGRKQIEALGAIVAELKATLRLFGRYDEAAQSLLMSLSTLLVQTRAAAILRGGSCPSESHTLSQLPSEYAASDVGV